MGRWLKIGGVEILLFAVPFMIDETWALQHLPYMVVIGFGLIASGLVWDHLPPSILRAQRWRWLDSETAARYFRDMLEGRDLEKVAAIIDFWGETPEDQLQYALTYLFEGINEGIIEATGIPANGTQRWEIPTPIPESQKGLPHVIVGGDGRKYRDVYFGRWSIRRYVEHIRYEEKKRSASDYQCVTTSQICML